MKRQIFLLFGLGVVVLGLVIALLLALGGDKGAHPAGAPAPPESAAPVSGPESRTLVRAAPATDAGAAGTSGEIAAPAGDAAAVRDWRDHRGAGDRPEPVVKRETLTTIRPDLLAIVKRCAVPMKTQQPPQKGRIIVTMHLKVVGGQVQVPNMMFQEVQVHDEAVLTCVRQGFEKAVLAAPPGQPDGEEDVSMAFPVP